VCADVEGEAAVVVEFQSTEGFTWLSREFSPVTIDGTALRDADRRALERLVRNARFFDLPARLPPARGGGDGVCRITIEHLGRRHSVSANEPVQGPALRKLIDRIRTIAAAVSPNRADLQRVHRPHPAAVRRNHDDVIARVHLKV
jgi:hypothetical protein